MVGMVPEPAAFPRTDFDDWAETYDASIRDEDFPFMGYAQILERIIRLAEPQEGMKVLDLGTGTGNLALRFAGEGCEMWCTDFSPVMLEKARVKLPGAHFYLHDLQSPLPAEIKGPFDRIVSAYVFHHFELVHKIRILKSLKDRLAENGKIMIGDVAFLNHATLEEMRAQAGEDWEEEYYWEAEKILPALEEAGFQAEYEQISPCAGIFSLNPNRAELQ